MHHPGKNRSSPPHLLKNLVRFTVRRVIRSTIIGNNDPLAGQPPLRVEQTGSRSVPGSVCHIGKVLLIGVRHPRHRALP